jgi:hypothetical protein
MIPIPINVTVGSVPNDYEPPNDVQGVLEAVPQFTTYTVQADGPAVVVSKTGTETEPGTGAQVGADLNSIWIWALGPGWLEAPRVMTGYKNTWWQVNTGKPGEIRQFCGAPSGYFDSSGYGIEWGGWEGWALCNGNNGTVNLSFRFVVPGYRYASGQGWITNVGTNVDQGGGQGIGGTGYLGSTHEPTVVDSVWGGWNKFQIHLYNLGSGTVDYGGVNIDLKAAGETGYVTPGKGQWPPRGGAHTIGPPGTASNIIGQWTYPIHQAGQMTNNSISRIPPYIALGYAQFIGYR